MATWNEIKQLAKDLQRVQLSGSAQRLSERNCIEIVQRLIDMKLLDVSYTIDGKEYITPSELGKEIKEELIVKDGRVDLIYLQSSLGVDLSHIEVKVSELVKNDRNLTLVLGQLIDRSYMDKVAEEINDKLQEYGQITVAELAKMYDLPGDFINEIIQGRLGRMIKAVRDPSVKNVYYTEAFVARYRAKIRGAFSSVTRPTSVSDVINQHGLHEHLFFSVLESLVSEGRLCGSVSGGARQDKAVYIPSCYTRAQNDWVDSFYRQNGYLEFDALVRLGISDPKSFIQKRFKSESLHFLESCCVGQLIKERIEADVDEALSTSSWVDIMPVLPSICSATDAEQLLQAALRHKPDAVLCTSSLVCSKSYLVTCQQAFDKLIRTKAEQTVRENPAILLSHFSDRSKQQSKSAHAEDDSKDRGRDNRAKKSTGAKSSGFGIGGREVKTKATKKKKVPTATLR